MDFVDAAEVGNAAWDAFIENSHGGWFWHTTEWRRYTIAYRPELASCFAGFAVRDAGRIVALVPLMTEHGPLNGDVVCTFGGEPCWSPALAPDLSTVRREAVLLAALTHAEGLARRTGAVMLGWRVTPLARDFGAYLAAFLAATTRLGYTDRSLCSRVMHLDQADSPVATHMTKGHRADIKRGRRLMDVDVLDGANCEPADFAAYRAMHAQAAGRITRPTETFERMEAWIAGGCALLLRARTGERTVGFIYILVSGDRAYYASAANDPACKGLPIGHVLQAAALRCLRERGIERYELGVQQFGPLPHDLPSAKELAISRFKRGFGGVTVPLVVRSLYLNPDRAVETMGADLHAYLDAVAPRKVPDGSPLDVAHNGGGQLPRPSEDRP